jgi:hypothetical protein
MATISTTTQIILVVRLSEEEFDLVQKALDALSDNHRWDSDDSILEAVSKLSQELNVWTKEV